MATQGPKVEKVTKGGKEKKPPKEKKLREKKAKGEARVNPEAQEEQGAQANPEKARDKADKKAQQAAAKAEKAQQKAAANEEKAQKKAAAKEERAAKKQAKSERAKAVKIARDGEEGKPAGKKKKLIMAAVAVVLVLLIAVSVIFLVRLLRGDSEETTASLPDSSASAPAPVQATVADGEKPVKDEGEPGVPEDGEKETKEPSELEKGKEPSKKEAEKAPSSEKSTSEKSVSSKTASDAPDASALPEDEAAKSKETAAQAVEGSAGTAGISAMLGSGAVPVDQRDVTKDTPTDKPKPGQIVAQTAKAGEESGTAAPAGESQPKKPEATPDKGTALTPPTKTQEVPDFKFSEESLNLPPFTYSANNALETAVHRDIGDFLAKKDDRPGTQITSVVIGGTIRQADGSLRVLAYAWGSRYAIAENTLFDYGNLVGPCAMDYTVGPGGYTLQKITLARAGDAFESSVREFCGEETDVADKMVGQAYDLELRGQMLRNVSNYIRQNNIPVDFFRASGQVYNRDGSIYLPPQTESTPEEATESSESGDALQEQYRVIQDMPE